MTEIDLEQIAVVAARECIKQEVGLEALGRLLRAYTDAYAKATGIGDSIAANMYTSPGLPAKHDAKMLALHIEPDTRGKYRRTPVFFADGSQAPHHSTVAAATDNLFDRLTPDVDTDEFVKEFLNIHPFIDGNGRTAWILFNWLNRTLDAPTPLPDYFGEDNT